MYLPSLQLLRSAQQIQKDQVNPETHRKQLRAHLPPFICFNEKVTFAPTNHPNRFDSACPTVNLLFALICSETLLSVFTASPLWSLMPRHNIYREHNIFQICFIGHYKLVPAWSASH